VVTCLSLPLEEILVTSHAPVDAMFTAEGHQVVIVAITGCGNHRLRVSNLR